MYICNNAEDAKELSLSSVDEGLLIQGLALLRKHKEEALAVCRKAYGARFTFGEADFGIDRIDALIQYLHGAPDPTGTPEPLNPEE